MKRHGISTRVALLVLALVVACGATIGGTFAWFTDEVAVQNNIITAGVLDIELYDGETKVTEETELFDDAFLWEPGAVMYKNLTVKNVGNLDLEYRMNIKVNDFNKVVDAAGNATDYNLTQILQYGIVEGGAAEGATREQVISGVKEWKYLEDLEAFGKDIALKAEDKATGETGADDIAMVIWWEPSNEDNNWNVQNGKTVDKKREGTTGEYLYVDMGITLEAKQLMSEEDDFGNDYDEEATYGDVPTADIIDIDPVVVTDFPLNSGRPDGYKDGVPLDSAYTFKTTQTAAEGAASPYAKWHADFVVSADKDIPADSIMLAGNYANYGWLGFYNENMEISADDEIRLLADTRGITINYAELCADVKEFMCGLTDLTGENAGTTVTVKLYLYEAPSTGTSSTVESETGKSFLVATKRYTFGEKEVDNGLPKATVINLDPAEIGKVGIRSLHDPLGDPIGYVTLASAYQFSADETADEAAAGEYGDWIADYVVSSDKEIPADSIVLAGQYDDFGTEWLAFMNEGDAVLADTEIRLLGLVGKTFTYKDICEKVKVFSCGLAEAPEKSLDGTTVTVKLCLFNPENEDDFQVVNSTSYKF